MNFRDAIVDSLSENPVDLLGGLKVSEKDVVTQRRAMIPYNLIYVFLSEKELVVVEIL